ncbi:restriction endonuclease subunit S [Legionella pneumophila serogroup 1]|uniref:restriction endonuclease subunit S n=1 Tax=Legionella pneumophila TaxID=446 RepID=UPI0005B2F5D3|nr:restriction endonuclease subunit S [Legionella pneumophila]ANN91266.1 hypothetical protein A9P85_00945 [Legionella pneumophila]MCZ4679292.1 restriction endonuclease subunit S [Legionella pneumophila]MCZ4749271.1 restriction endonuclease subunit S [Legionella pneumophila]MDW8863626.1 restriction endonuclease subunit S [Legionella pneumophila]MDW8888227.1 restriction endonuclease subunit S [Legionella pneumophila]
MAAKNYLSELEFMQARIKEVPDGWGFSTVGKTFSIKNNLRKPINENERNKNIGEYPYYGPTKIQGYIDTYEQNGSYVLIGEDGDHFLKFKNQSMTQLVDGKCTVNNHAHIVEGTHKATREWFYYYFMHRDIFSFLSRQGAGRYKLNKVALEKIPILVPPISEQKKIAQILSTWDKAITTTEKLLANSEQQKKALMQQLLTGKILFPTDTSAWRSFTLSEIFDFKKGRGLSKDMITSRGKNRCILYGELYTQYNEVIKNVVSRTDSNDGLPSKSGDVLLPCSTTTTGTDLAKAVALFEDGILLGGDINVLRPKISVDSAFLAYLLTHVKRNAIASKAQGITIIHLYGSDLKNLEVTIPEILREQQKISSVISIVDGEIEKLKQKLDCLKIEKKALMQQLLTGKRRVRLQGDV